MKRLVSILLLCMGFPRILSVRDEVPGQQKGLCVDTTGASKDLENHLGSYLLSLLENSDANQTLQIEEVEKAFVPDLYNASSFLVPRLVYVLFTCNSSEDKQDVIDDERAFVWASEYLFVYMHPAVIRLVSLLDVTLLSPSVYTLRMCIPNVCSNTTEVFSFEETILKVRESVFHRKAHAFMDRLSVSTHFTFSDTWKSYLYHQTGYIINLKESLQDFYMATYSLFMGVFFLALFMGMVVMIAFSSQIINKLVIHEKPVNGNTKKSYPVLYRWSGVFSSIVCCQVLLMFICYLIASFKELSSETYPDDLSFFSMVCHIMAYVFIWFVGFCYGCCLPQFFAKKYFKNKLSLRINRRSCGCSDRLLLGFALTFCTLIFYHFLFGLVVFLYYPLLVICVLVSRLTYLTVLGLCVFTSIRLYMTFGICHFWIYCSAFIQIIIIWLYYSVLYGLGTMLGIGYTLENTVLLKYIIMASFLSVGVIVISYYVYMVCCSPLFYTEKELLKARRQKKREDETVINMSELSPTGAGNNSNEVAMINPMAHAPNKVVYFAGGVLLIKGGNITWIPVDQK